MHEPTITITEGLDRGDLLTRLDAQIGNAIELFARTEQLPQSVARAHDKGYCASPLWVQS